MTVQTLLSAQGCTDNHRVDRKSGGAIFQAGGIAVSNRLGILNDIVFPANPEAGGWAIDRVGNRHRHGGGRLPGERTHDRPPRTILVAPITLAAPAAPSTTRLPSGRD